MFHLHCIHLITQVHLGHLWSEYDWASLQQIQSYLVVHGWWMDIAELLDDTLMLLEGKKRDMRVGGVH